ncbi:hypothetical protein ACUHMQ_13485 [Chitinimonas sp. PSY-7]|uniref:hypothetical protein n=1 Tax=Chitinimonas sp. PSY-7 TaxID=3459088 RepID=UPI004040038D
MFDIDSIQEVQEAKCELVDPKTGRPVGASITLAGQEHPKRMAMVNARHRKMRHDIAKHGRVQPTDPEEDVERLVNELVTCTLGWEGFMRDGKPVPCTPEEVRALYANPKRGWLRLQVQTFLNENTNFIQHSGTD